MQGIFNSRPPMPRYSFVWDIEVVLGHIRSMPSSSQLSIQQLSWKLATLMALTNADRASDLHLLDISFMQIQDQEVSFKIPGLSKTRRSGPPREVSYASFSEAEIICPVNTLKVYLQQTEKFRSVAEDGSNPLFIAIRKPHKPVTSATISRWMKNLMEQSGIDVEQFKPHSVRAAATSAASNLGVSIKDILKAANWARESTFLKFYHKPIIKDTFGKAILNGR